MGPGGQRGEAGARACRLSAARAEVGLALSAGRSWAMVWAARFGLEKGKEAGPIDGLPGLAG